MPLEGLQSISPDYFKIVRADENEIPLAFSVQDDSGIEEIKNRITLQALMVIHMEEELCRLAISFYLTIST